MLTGSHKPGSIPLSLFCVVCDREKGEVMIAAMRQERPYFGLAMLGKGTANSRILGYLGIGERDKTVFWGVLPTAAGRSLLQSLDEEMDFRTPGHGIGFMTGIHEGCYHRLVQIASEEEEGKMMAQQPHDHDLIMVIMNHGYTEEVMEVARAAGATGGTVLHARGWGLSGAEHFFGVSIQPEKDILMIVADRQDSCAIMQAIADKTGPDSDAGAVSFSTPVSDVRGISADVPGEVASPPE